MSQADTHFLRAAKHLGAATMAAVVAGCAAVASPTHSPALTTKADTTTDWQAMSTTAMSITGDITLSGDRITFANGQFLDLQPVEQDAANGQTLFRVTTKANPELLNGNRICGSQPIDYLLAQTREGAPGQSELQLMAYYYPAPLRLAQLPLKDKNSVTHMMCALYTYTGAPDK